MLPSLTTNGRNCILKTRERAVLLPVNEKLTVLGGGDMCSCAARLDVSASPNLRISLTFIPPLRCSRGRILTSADPASFCSSRLLLRAGGRAGSLLSQSAGNQRNVEASLHMGSYDHAREFDNNDNNNNNNNNSYNYKSIHM